MTTAVRIPDPRSPLAARVIAASGTDRWVERLLQRYDVTAPVRGSGGDALFAIVGSPGEVLWEFENPLLPPKSALLPQTDPIVRIQRRNGKHTVDAITEARPRLLLNARSCDVTALRFLADMYDRDLPDAEVRRRADALTIISLSCPQPCELGFCICCDAGPFLREGADVQLTPLPGQFLAEALTPRGVDLLERDRELFADASPAAVSDRERLEREALGRFGDETCHFGSAMRRISARRVSDDLWDEVSRWCLGCGSCTFVCPTCFCFSGADRALGPDEWERCRTWDSCQYSTFTLEASGHNPRQQQRERVKRRFYHKVSAQYYARDGRVGCVGCGRCVRTCMGCADMPAVVRAIRQGTFSSGGAHA
jgi:ferredoxin